MKGLQMYTSMWFGLLTTFVHFYSGNVKHLSVIMCHWGQIYPSNIYIRSCQSVTVYCDTNQFSHSHNHIAQQSANVCDASSSD